MAGFTGGNITERSYGDRFSRAASKKAKNESKGENEHPTHRTKASMKRASSLMQDTLRLSVFHRGNTGEQFLRHAKGLRNLADEGASTPVEMDHDKFVSLNFSLIVTFNRARYRFVGCFKKHERGKNQGSDSQTSEKWIHRPEPKPARLEDRW